MIIVNRSNTSVTFVLVMTFLGRDTKSEYMVYFVGKDYPTYQLSNHAVRNDAEFSGRPS